MLKNLKKARRLADTQAGIFFGRYPHRLCKGLEEAAVIPEAAFFKGFVYAGAFAQGRFCNADAPGGDILADRGAGGLLENPANIGFAEKEAFRQLFHGDGMRDVLVDIGQNIVYLAVVFEAAFPGICRVCVGKCVNHYHQLHKRRLFYDIVCVASGGGDFVDIIEKALLLFLVQGELVLKTDVSAGKAVIQISVGGGEPLRVVRVNRQDNALVELIVNLSQLVAFILVDNEQVPRCDGIEAVVNEELFSAGDRIVQLIAVMDVHFHGFFFFIKVRHGEGLGALTVFNGNFAGCYFFHKILSFLFCVKYGNLYSSALYA